MSTKGLLEAKFHWVVGHPSSEEEGDQRLVIPNGSVFPEIAVFRGGRWKLLDGTDVEFSRHSPFLIPKSGSGPFKVPS